MIVFAMVGWALAVFFAVRAIQLVRTSRMAVKIIEEATVNLRRARQVTLRPTPGSPFHRVIEVDDDPETTYAAKFDPSSVCRPPDVPTSEQILGPTPPDVEGLIRDSKEPPK
jgi:hypothetical protein